MFTHRKNMYIDIHNHSKVETKSTTEEWINKLWYIHVMDNVGHKVERSTDTCYNVDES